MNQYWEQQTPNGFFGVDIKWSTRHQHYHCFIWRDPSEYATLVFASTVDSLDLYVDVSQKLGIKIPNQMLSALVDDRGRMHDNYKVFITPAEYDALPLEKRIADTQQSINNWLSQGWEAKKMGDTHWAEECAEKVSKYEAILAQLEASRPSN
nr:Hypothetical protein Drgb7_00009 [uncultured bacterium]